jgi:hypothetical protein
VEPIIAMNRLKKPIDQGEFNTCEKQASNTESRTKELKLFCIYALVMHWSRKHIQ